MRVSGSLVKDLIATHFQPLDAVRWEQARRAERHSGTWHLPNDAPWCDAPLQGSLQLPLDVLLWPTSRSYTGQPLAELHLVGSPPLLEAIVTQLIRGGARIARPGEFTLRAFLAGRLDLLQAEAVLGVIDAADHTELELALRQLAGGISHEMARLRGDLLDLLAELEAGLDFVDEDIEFVSRDQLLTRVNAARQTVAALCDQASRRLHSATRPRVVLAGLPNAGKSTLLNALCGTAAAIVSDVRGTTRDYLCVPLSRSGLQVDLIDTAGWDVTASGIDAVAQQKRHEQWQQADVIVWCSDLSADQAAADVDDRLFAELQSERRPVLRVGTKADLANRANEPRRFGAIREAGIREGEAPAEPRTEGKHGSVETSPSPFWESLIETMIPVSAESGAGLDALCERLAELLAMDSHGQRQWLGMTAARCQGSLLAARDALDRTADAVALGLSDDLIAIELRDALEHLGHVVGAVYTDDVLDRIFSKFCIGK